MGNGVSVDQGNLPARGKRDVREGFGAGQHDWSELARTREIVTSPPKPTSYIGASNVGLKSSTEDNVRVGANARSVPDSYIGVPSVGPSSSNDTRSVAYIVGQPGARRNKKSEMHSSTEDPHSTTYIDASSTRSESLSVDSDMRDDANVRAVPEAYIGATTARLESSIGSSIHVDASGAEFKPTVGNMYDIAKHECDDAVTSEFETRNISQLQRRLPESREDNEQSSVMKDDAQSGKYSDTRLRHWKKKEDRSLKTEESKTKGNT